MVRYGCQTPSQSVILDYEKTLSQEAIDIYKKTDFSPYPWQEKLIKDIFAVNDDGLWTHSKFGYAVPRRNGKTEIVYMAELWFLMDGKNIIHTAHRISTSHSSFKKLKKYLQKMGLVDKVDFKSIKAKGQEMKFFGQKFRVFGKELEGIDHSIPLSWNKKVWVEAYE